MKDFSSVSWLTKEKYEAMPAWERALHWASVYAVAKVKESRGNTGFWPALFLSKVGLGPGYAWCAAFVFHCLDKAGADRNKLPNKWKGASVREWVLWAKAGGRLKDAPKRGHLFYWLSANGTGHIGFVRNTASWPEWVETIEGNTNASGGREGDGVYYKDRRKNALDMNFESGFIDLRGL